MQNFTNFCLPHKKHTVIPGYILATVCMLTSNYKNKFIKLFLDKLLSALTIISINYYQT